MTASAYAQFYMIGAGSLGIFWMILMGVIF